MAKNDVIVGGTVRSAPLTASDMRLPPVSHIPSNEDDMATDSRVYLPKQRVRRGVAGYKGDPAKIKVIDPDTGQEVKGYVTPVIDSRPKRG